MPDMSVISIVTSNTKKYSEIAHILLNHGIESIRVNADLFEPQSLDARDIVRTKALEAFRLVQGPVIVDDSGFYIDKYNRFPGTLSKYIFRGIGYDGLFRLCAEGDRAHFECTVAYMDADCTEPVVCVGTYAGHITDQYVGDPKEEMPYARIFVPDDAQGKVLSFMSAKEREHDHRNQALRQCIAHVRSRN